MDNSSSSKKYNGYEKPMRSDEAAEYLGMAKKVLLEYARQGEIPAVKRGGSWYFSTKKLAKWAGVDFDE